MKKQSLKLESLNSGKFTPLSSNAMQNARGGQEFASEGATATVSGQQVPFDHDTTCVIDGKMVTQFLSKDDRLLASRVGSTSTVFK